VQAHAGQRILEVGNCLAHFHAHDHDVLDKYERAPGVRNEDVVDFRPEAPYDLVLSVSTLEHVGWDEEPREPGKVRRAIEHLRGFLAPGGTLWFTVPLGYNPEVDRLVRERDLPLTDLRFLRRTSGATNRWREVGYEAARDAEYGRPYRAANAVAVGTVRAA
jgi:SAM-dependent methyltransferase